MSKAEKYILGLKNAYLKNNSKVNWEHFEKIKHGISNEDLLVLTNIYPDIPNALINLLEFVDGTYWREYNGEKIVFYFLGSDVQEFSYYLLSSEQIIKNQNIAKLYSGYIERLYERVYIDEKITNNVATLNWLHFSDCFNNGGSSQLFIDFSPSEKGKIGQIVRFLHDPDEFKVIADSFEDYLQFLINKEYDFIYDEEDYI